MLNRFYQGGLKEGLIKFQQLRLESNGTDCILRHLTWLEHPETFTLTPKGRNINTHVTKYQHSQHFHYTCTEYFDSRLNRG